MPTCTRGDGTTKTCGSDGCGGSCGTCTGDLTCTAEGTCDCDFFSQVKYTFTLAPQAEFPTSFSFVALNLTHTDLDGDVRRDGAFLGFGATDRQSFSFTVFGCRPNLTIKREYALSGKSCVAEETFTNRTDFVIPAPIVNADGSCTAPPL